MAQLKDLIVNGASRLVGDAFANKIQITTIAAPTSSGGSTYGTGTDGQVLKSNGTSVYWATLGTMASAAASDYVLKSGDTMTGKLTVVGNGSSAFNDYGIHFTNNSRIGENSSGGLGIYAPDKVYIRPGSSTTPGSYGLEVTTTGITVGNSDIIFATGSYASTANGVSFKDGSTIVGHIGMDNALGIYSKNDIAIRPGSGSIATTDGFNISTTAITPKKDATMNIGTSSYKFANIYGTLKGNADTASAVPLSGVTGAIDLQAIEALEGTSGLLRKTAADTWSLDTNDYITGMTILSYKHSTWNDFITAYNSNRVVYCRASSNTDPGNGSQSRLAFMAYVNNATTPTNVEFQYYRSVATHTQSQQGDQVFVYKLDSSSGWSVTTREASVKVAYDNGITGTYSNGVMTLKHANTAITAQNTQAVYPIKIDAYGHITGYGASPTTLSGYGITDAVTNVAYDSSTHNITKTINGTTSDVVVMPIIAGTGTRAAIGGVTSGTNACIASGADSFAFGYKNTASGGGSVAFGSGCICSGTDCFSIGYQNTVSANYSNALGFYNVITQSGSVAIGAGLKVSSQFQNVIGTYNIEDTNSTYCLIIGNGEADDARSNALTVDRYGNLSCGAINTYTLAAACAKGVDTSITAGSSSTNLPTTAAVVNFMQGNSLPSVTSTDNGKVLTVVNGAWAAANLPIYNGSVT